MGRQPTNDVIDRIGPKVWARFLLHHLGCQGDRGLDDLDAQLALPLAPTERFQFRVSPAPLEPALRRSLFRASFKDGRNPDGVYVTDLDDTAKFNLYERVTRRIPESAPWLLRDLKPYLGFQCPPIDISTEVCHRLLGALNASLVANRYLEAWVAEEPDSAARAEEHTFSVLVNAALPQSVALMFAITHVFAWNRTEPQSRLGQALSYACREAMRKFTATFEPMGFEDARDIARTLDDYGCYGLESIWRHGLRSALSPERAEPELWDCAYVSPDHLIIVPNTQQVREAMLCLHAGGRMGWEISLLPALPRRYFDEWRGPETLRQAAADLRETPQTLGGALSRVHVPPTPGRRKK